MSDDSVLALAAAPRPPDPGDARRRTLIQRLQIMLYTLGIIGGLGSAALLVMNYMSEQRTLVAAVSAMRVEVSGIAEEVRAAGRNYPLLEQRVTGLESRADAAARHDQEQDRRIGAISEGLTGVRAQLEAEARPGRRLAPR